MKRYLDLALGYAAAGLAAGVFYREFTKWNSFTGVTSLGKAHGHLLALGTLMFLLVALFAKDGALEKQRPFRLFLITYNTGLIITASLLIARGIPQVLGITLSPLLSAAISGIAGLGHLALGIGLIMFLAALRRLQGI